MKCLHRLVMGPAAVSRIRQGHDHHEFRIRRQEEALGKIIDHRACLPTARRTPRVGRAVGHNIHWTSRHRAHYRQLLLHYETELMPCKTRKRRKREEGKPYKRRGGDTKELGAYI